MTSVTTADLQPYAGLVHKTAALVLPSVPLEFDDIVQALWLKVMYALQRHDAARHRMTERAYVFMAVTDKVKDLRRLRRRPECYIEDLRFQSQDKWDHENGLAVDADVTFAEAEDEPVVLPSTLTDEEREVISLLLIGYRQAEAGRELGWAPRRIERTMLSIRTKLADWAPDSSAPTLVQADELELLLAA